jgi:hypothetical protein
LANTALRRQNKRGATENETLSEILVMSDREQRHGGKGHMDPSKTRRDRVPHSDEVIGQDVPDESKERHTEIAVDAGKKMGDRHADKH